MRRLALLIALGASLLTAGTLVLYLGGHTGLDAEARRLDAQAHAQRQRALDTLRDTLQRTLDETLAREDARPFYEYRELMLPPDLLSNTPALVPSPLSKPPTDPLIDAYFELRDGTLRSPEPHTQLPDDLLRLPLATLPPAPTREEAVDAFLCNTYRDPESALDALGQPFDAANASLQADWDAYRNRRGYSQGNYADPSDPRLDVRPDVVVSTSTFHLLPTPPDPTGWPQRVVALRSVEAQGQRWHQGFSLDLPHLQHTLLPALLDDVQLPDLTPLTMDLAPSLSPTPDTATLVLLPNTTGERTLPHPLHGLSLRFSHPTPDPQHLLAPGRRLLDGALALVVVVVALGSVILAAAAHGQRRLARQRADFVAALTHELKAPLTGIQALTELLHDDLVTDDAQRRSYYATILGETHRLSRLVHNVLDASQLERGSLPVSLTPLDPLPLVLSLLEPFRPRLDAEDFSLTLQLPDELPLVLADRDGLAHVVANLLDNAVKYGRADTRQLTVSLALEHPHVTIRIRDHGPGIPPRERKRVFHHFVRGRSAPLEVGGAGLGLAIAHAQAQAMNCTLSYEPPTDGPGAQFSLQLPLAPPEHTLL